MFTVAKISKIRSALGFEKDVLSKGRLESPPVTDIKRVCNISNRKQPVEGEQSCGGNWTNQRATNCISGRSIKFSGNLVGTIIEADFGYLNSSNTKIQNITQILQTQKIKIQNITQLWREISGNYWNDTPALVVAMK